MRGCVRCWNKKEKKERNKRKLDLAMATFRRDENLIAALMQLPTVEARAALIRQLHPDAVRRLCTHLSNIVMQKRNYKLRDPAAKQAVTQALQSHSKVVKRITNGKRLPNLRSQRGSGFPLIPMILSAVVPLIADFAKNALSKKK